MASRPVVVALGTIGALILVLIVVAAVMLNQKHTITGTFTVYNSSGLGCDLGFGYSDIHEGTVVAVENGKGEEIAVGRLESGQAGVGYCEFPFTIEDVPDAYRYGFTVTSRGTIKFSKQQLESDNWNAEITLGL